MSVGLKTLAVLFLYVSFWEISQLPVFAADAFSYTTTDFTVPGEVMEMISAIMDKKLAEGKQFVISLPAEQSGSLKKQNGRM